MNLLAVRLMEFKGADELSGKQQQAVEPTFYNDGTVELQVSLAGKEMSAYVRFSIADVVRMRSETSEVQDVPENG